MERGCLALLRGSFWFGVLPAVRYCAAFRDTCLALRTKQFKILLRYFYGESGDLL